MSALGARETYTGKWFGFITDSADVNKGHNISPDDIRKSVATKDAKYTLINALFAGRVELAPADKVAAFAGQQVFVYGSITTDSLTKGNNAVPNSVGPGGAIYHQRHFNHAACRTESIEMIAVPRSYMPGSDLCQI